MTPQLQLDLQAPLARPRQRIGSRLAREWPAWLALAFCAQASALGLVPALRESRRLGQAEERLLGRYEEDVAQQYELARLQRAQSDPIYRERELRLLRTPGSPLRRR